MWAEFIVERFIAGLVVDANAMRRTKVRYDFGVSISYRLCEELCEACLEENVVVSSNLLFLLCRAGQCARDYRGGSR